LPVAVSLPPPASCASALGEFLGGGSRSEVEHPPCELGLRGSEDNPVDVEEQPHRFESRTLVAVHEDLTLGDAVSEHRALEGEVSVAVMLVRRWAMGRRSRDPPAYEEDSLHVEMDGSSLALDHAAGWAGFSARRRMLFEDGERLGAS
jgi:hypothetical protein